MARSVLKAHGFFVDNLWHVKDIFFLCEQKGMPPLSAGEATAVFEIANSRFDGEQGINWPQLEVAIHAYLYQKEVLEVLCDLVT